MASSRYTIYVLLDFPNTILHNVDNQQHSRLESLSNELLLIVLKDLPLLDRINIALTAKRYLAFMSAERLLHIYEGDMSMSSVVGVSKDLIRIASPPGWTTAWPGTHASQYEAEMEVMRPLIPYIDNYDNDVCSIEWDRRVSDMVEWIGGFCTRGLMRSIEYRGRELYDGRDNGYWWHPDIHAELDEDLWSFDKFVYDGWITGWPWGDASWDEHYSRWQGSRDKYEWEDSSETPWRRIPYFEAYSTPLNRNSGGDDA